MKNSVLLHKSLPNSGTVTSHRIHHEMSMNGSFHNQLKVTGDIAFSLGGHMLKVKVINAVGDNGCFAGQDCFQNGQSVCL